MSALAKEKIFEELRKYHQDAFPKKLATPRMEEMRTQFIETEDKIITMLLRLVNGKEVFADSTEELNSFEKRIQNLSVDDSEQDNYTIFRTKIDKLTNILKYAKETGFQLRKIRPRKGDVKK